MGQLVTFLSDFGLSDSYVAEAKAVLLARRPALGIVDISHQVPSYNVEWGAFQLLRSYRFFPKQTAHLAVVDPGVGTERRNVYVRTRDYHFVGPDNGVLLWAVRDCEKREKKRALVYEIAVPKGVGPTFYGRDVFAPFLAGLLAKKVGKLKAGKALLGRDFPVAKREGERWEGVIVGADHFGNLVTSIPVTEEGPVRGRISGLRDGIEEAGNYLAIEKGKAGLVRGSHGFWEIACRTGSAAELLRVKAGDVVSVFPAGAR